MWDGLGRFLLSHGDVPYDPGTPMSCLEVVGFLTMVALGGAVLCGTLACVVLLLERRWKKVGLLGGNLAHRGSGAVSTVEEDSALRSMLAFRSPYRAELVTMCRDLRAVRLSEDKGLDKGAANQRRRVVADRTVEMIREFRAGLADDLDGRLVSK